MVRENDVARLVIGLALRVHRELGPGLLESAYEKALAREFDKAGCAYQRQALVPFRYDGDLLGPGFRADFIVEDAVLLEIKSMERTAPVHTRQIVTYLRMTGLRLGLLLNFGADLLKHGITRVANGLPDE